QEQLTKQIAQALIENVESKGVSIVIDARHIFIKMRGIQKANSNTTTSALSKIFLKNESFMPYHGKNEAFALLFPMEKIFEDYVAYMLKKVNPAQDIKVQNNGKYLISKNDENCFMLKPDLYIENKMILDTKWKIPNDSEDEKKQGIEQSDLYQMFAYACKFKIYDIKLVYPLCEKTQDLQRKIAEKFFVFKASEHLYFKEQGQKDIKVQVCFAPLPF
ncbi:GTP cyclohydrolase I, partial [Campylobacter jejuni]